MVRHGADPILHTGVRDPELTAGSLGDRWGTCAMIAGPAVFAVVSVRRGARAHGGGTDGLTIALEVTPT